MDIGDPYPYSLNGIELTHWNVFQALYYLAKFEYLPTYPHERPLPPKIDELKQILEDPTNDELARSIAHDGFCYFKPWDAASVALRRWSCAEDKGTAYRLNQFAQWPRIEIDKLFSTTSWSLRESLHVIWGRKLFHEPDVIWRRFGENEYEAVIPQIEMDLLEVQSPFVQAFEADFPHEINYDAGPNMDRFHRSTVLRWCSRRGIPLRHVNLSANDLRSPTESTEATEHATSRLPSSGTWRVDEENVELRIHFRIGEPANAKFKLKNLQGKLVRILCMAGDTTEITGGDIIRELYPDKLEGTPSKEVLKNALQNTNGVINDTRKSLERAGVPVEILPMPGTIKDLPHARIKLNIPNFKMGH